MSKILFKINKKTAILFEKFLLKNLIFFILADYIVLKFLSRKSTIKIYVLENLCKFTNLKFVHFYKNNTIYSIMQNLVDTISCVW